MKFKEVKPDIESIIKALESTGMEWAEADEYHIDGVLNVEYEDGTHGYLPKGYNICNVLMNSTQAQEFKRIIEKDYDAAGRVFWSVSFPEVPGCVGGGATPNEAMEAAEENLKIHLEFLYRTGLQDYARKYRELKACMSRMCTKILGTIAEVYDEEGLHYEVASDKHLPELFKMADYWIDDN